MTPKQVERVARAVYVAARVYNKTATSGPMTPKMASERWDRMKEHDPNYYKLHLVAARGAIKEMAEIAAMKPKKKGAKKK